MYQSRRTTVIRRLLFALTLLILLAGAAYSPSNTTYSALPGCECRGGSVYPIPCYDYDGACGCGGKICDSQIK